MIALKTNMITITDPYVKRAQDNLVNYLLSMQSNKFLYEFFKVAGLKPLTNEGYQGWERSDQVNFRGHFFGHFMSALALAYHAEKNDNVRARILKEMQDAVTGLEKVQLHYAQINPNSAGYISAFRETALDEVEGIKVPAEARENVLVPWYNLHKVLAGLLDIHQSLKKIDSVTSEKALTIASNFGDYIYNRMMRLEDKNKMLEIEYGGMNDALYNLFGITKKKEHMIAATYFDEDGLFEKLVERKNVLSGKHANTMIPKLIGAIKRYITFQDDEMQLFLAEHEKDNLRLYYEAAANFWDIVVNNHTYCTGGNSQGEHFHEPNQLYYDVEYRNGDCTCETCNTHNMLKLTRDLYFVSKDKKYLDYYERTYINSILASQNPENGMMMYFQPMGAGYNKVYNRPHDEFWCCTGTGVESFAKLADTYYFQEHDHILVNLYFSNEVSFLDKNIRLVQNTDRKNGESQFTLQPLSKKQDASDIQIGFRIPCWTNKFDITQNGVRADYEIVNGFAYLNKPMHINDKIEVKFYPELTLESTKDNENYVAFKYGPYVLAGGLGAHNMHLDDPNGIIVRVGTKERLLPDTLTTLVDGWKENYKNHMKLIDHKEKLIAFLVKGVKESIIFSPYYEMHGERYGIYFKLQKEDSKEAQTAIKKRKEFLRLQELILDELTNFDDNNSEYAKNVSYDQSRVDAFWGRRYRQAFEKGWFSYDFSINTTENFYLQLEFHREDTGKKMELILQNKDVRVITVGEAEKDQDYLKQIITIDKGIVHDDNKLNVKIKSVEKETPKIFGITFLKALRFSNKVSLKEIEIISGTISPKNFLSDEYEVTIEKNGHLLVHVENDSSLVFMNDILIDETVPRQLEDGHNHLTIYAPDHQTKKKYLLKVKNM